jgi:hypothetical protein
MISMTNLQRLRLEIMSIASRLALPDAQMVRKKKSLERRLDGRGTALASQGIRDARCGRLGR